MGEITIVVVDDHPLFRQGVVDALMLEADLQVVGQAADGEEALQMLRELQPQVALIDVNLPGLNGQQVLRQAAGEKLPTRILLLTAYDDPSQRLHALRGGAAAYCSKDVQPERLVELVRLAAEGKYIIGEQVLEYAELERWLAGHTDNALRAYGDPGEPYSPLSGREMEVLGQVTKGLSNKEIALALGISHQTVKNHVTAILRKLGVEDRTQAAIYALRRGWVRLHEQKSEAQEPDE
jgi:DNA-binding NarL/FixJ family response regulator